MSSNRELPVTKLVIGMKVDPKKVLSQWARSQILRRQIKETRTILNRMQRKGYGQGGPGRRMHRGNKDQIRKAMFVVDNAYEAEVCGIIPHSMHIVGSVANQCYVPGVPCAAGGITYYAYLLFRARLNDDRQNFVGFVPSRQEYLFDERDIMECLINPETPVRWNSLT